MRARRTRRLRLGLASLLASGSLTGFGCAVVAPSAEMGPEAGPALPHIGHPSGDRGSPANDAGVPPPRLACPPDPLPYEAGPDAPATVGHQRLCSQGQIEAFIAACLEAPLTATPGCEAWVSSNTQLDGGTGTACGDCLFAPKGENNGAVWVDPLGYFLPNFGACIEIMDPVSGRACGQALMSTLGCQNLACEYCPDTDNEYNDCINAVNSTSCASYLGATDSICPNAANAFQACTKLGTADQNFQNIATLVCGDSEGGGTDAGSIDGAADVAIDGRAD
jgi:hypothetical protein